MERSVLAGWSDHRSPAARGPSFVEGNLGEALAELAPFFLGPDDVEGVVLEDAKANPIAVGQPAVLAIVAVVDLLGRAGKSVAMEGAVDDRGHPPARDRVLPKLEQAGGHSGGTRAGEDRLLHGARLDPSSRGTELGGKRLSENPGRASHRVG